jgi:hypothetical protein
MSCNHASGWVIVQQLSSHLMLRSLPITSIGSILLQDAENSDDSKLKRVAECLENFELQNFEFLLAQVLTFCLP